MNSKLTTIHDEVLEELPPVTYHLEIAGHTIAGQSESVLFSYRTSGEITDPDDNLTYDSTYQVSWSGSMQNLFEHAQTLLRVFHAHGILSRALGAMLADLPTADLLEMLGANPTTEEE